MDYAPFEPTPPETVEVIKDIIKDKTVYELGAGDGIFAKAMQKYAKEVVVVEKDHTLAGCCVANGFDVLIEDFLDVDLSKADVIFIFMSKAGNYALREKLFETGWKGIVISHFHEFQGDDLNILPPDDIIKIKLDSDYTRFLIYKF